MSKPSLYFTLALILGALPLWAGQALPSVDLPQHLHLISVLHRLKDSTTLYPQWFEARGQLTPYLGYYYVVHLLNYLMPLHVANRLFLTVYVCAFPISVAFLLKSLRRPLWPALLALPFAYGDSFAWGFINYVGAIPLGLFACGLMIRTVEDAARRRWWAGWLSTSAVAVLLFHVQMFAFLAVALPLLLLLSKAPEDGLRLNVRARGWALGAVFPSVVLFFLWFFSRLGEPTAIEAGAPWKAWGPMWSKQNLAFKTFAQNLTDAWSLPANLLRNESDRFGFYAAVAVAGVGLLLSLVRPQPPLESGWQRIRLPLLAATAWAMFFFMPFDIRGYMYYLNSRFVHLAWPLLLACVPLSSLRLQKFLGALALFPSLLLSVALFQGVRQFNLENQALENLSMKTLSQSKVMGLVFDSFSRVVSHPVYLHSAAVLARHSGGVPNFSFALTPHSPLKYRLAPPPTFASEWRPGDFNYDTMGTAYDVFLVRGAHPRQVFGNRLDHELSIGAQENGFFLVTRR